jgi:hypothetical protein
MRKNIILLLAAVLIMVGGAVNTSTRASALNIQPPPPLNVPITLTKSGIVEVTVYSLGGGCSGDFGINAPVNSVLVADYNHKQGVTVQVGTLTAGTSLIFYLSPSDWCADILPQPAYSNDIERAHVTRLGNGNIWRVDWEDLPKTAGKKRDGDFNDLIVVVRLQGEVAGYEQDSGSWNDDPYANLPGTTIGSHGAALTSLANLLSIHGSLANPGTLNNCLLNNGIQGYYQGFIRWNKGGWCSNPTAPFPPPYLVEWTAKLNYGDRANIPGRGVVTVDSTLLQELIDADLNTAKVPVILEIDEGGLTHTVVALTGSGGTYSILDPYGASGKTEVSMPEVKGIIRFAKSDGKYTPVLTVNAPAGTNFVITDPSGRRTGNDGAQAYAEIPNSNFYHLAALMDKANNQAYGAPYNELYVINPELGWYTITVYGASGSIQTELHGMPLGTLLQTFDVSTSAPRKFLVGSHIFMPLAIR